MAKVFERVAQQDALARLDRLALLAVASGTEADVHPALDVRARNLEQAHLGVLLAVVGLSWAAGYSEDRSAESSESS